MSFPGRIRTSADLLGFALKHAPSRACQREIVAGRAEVLGGFSSIQPFDRPGWIVRVLSRHGKTWILSVEVDEARHILHCRELDEVPWSTWTGYVNRQKGNPYDGDRPHDYALEHHLSLRAGSVPSPVSGDRTDTLRNRKAAGEEA